MLLAKGVNCVLHILRTEQFETRTHLTVSNTTWHLSQKSLKQGDLYLISITERTMRERRCHTDMYFWFSSSSVQGDAILESRNWKFAFGADEGELLFAEVEALHGR